MRIVIDMQGVQTNSRFQSIGRYTLSLVEAIIINRGEHEIYLALNGMLPEAIIYIRDLFGKLLPYQHIVTWTAATPVRACEDNNEFRRHSAEYIREAFLASLNPDVILLSSLFEGYEDDAVTSIGSLNLHIPTVAIIYDLLPYFHPKIYLEPNTRFHQYYLHKLNDFKRASHWLAISKSVADEGRQGCNLNEEDIGVINAAPDSMFRPIKILDAERASLLKNLGISKPFLLCTGGADLNKNFNRLLKAYRALPRVLKNTYMLVITGEMSDSIKKLIHAADKAGVKKNQYVFTGYVTDADLIALYNLCIAFVYPSLNGGFALSVLEAMACGAPVICSDISNLSELIDNSNALFDPYDEASIRNKIKEILTNEELRMALSARGLKQAKMYSWKDIARRAISSMEKLFHQTPRSSVKVAKSKPTLAFVSPLPPERSGISTYSFELIPALAKYYDIYLVVEQKQVELAGIREHVKLQDTDWLRKNVHEVDRVIYHMGNSGFHEHMLELIKYVPGVLVLHDFFLNGLLPYLQARGDNDFIWAESLYHSHGYPAVADLYLSANKTQLTYPVNLEVIQFAMGTIIHSNFSRNLAAHFYNQTLAEDWALVPLLRKPHEGFERKKSRMALGMKEDDFVICSFGFISGKKLNHRLLNVWLRSNLRQQSNCYLIFVGENSPGEYGQGLVLLMELENIQKQVRITGWVNQETYNHFIAAADIGVQLRTASQGETSAAVLDCMLSGMPVIVNTNGSMMELPNDAVWMLPDSFTDSELEDALNFLYTNKERRVELGNNARAYVANRHAPDACARQYAEAIEKFYTSPRIQQDVLIRSIAQKQGKGLTDMDCQNIAKSIKTSFPFVQPTRQLLIDISATCQTDMATGIERVARAITRSLLQTPPTGYRVEPVYLIKREGQWDYCYARRYSLGVLNCPTNILKDDIVEPRNGDIMIGLDISNHALIEASAQGLLRQYRNLGVRTYFTIYDILPIQMPECFPPGTEKKHTAWLKAVAQNDGAICISQTVARAMKNWLVVENSMLAERFKIKWFHLGADVESSIPSTGMPNNALSILKAIKARPSFLMVSTIEPRKGHLQTIDAFTELWLQNVDANLVIVGNEGWQHVPRSERRTIPQIVERLQNHKEARQRLFWLPGVSDEFLSELYIHSTCLIAASEGEGFGLPLIEAAQHKLPILARDIEVFREVAGDHAYYFKGEGSADMVLAINQWLALYINREHPRSDSMPWLTWKESTACLLNAVLSTPPKSLEEDSQMIERNVNNVET